MTTAIARYTVHCRVSTGFICWVENTSKITPYTLLEMLSAWLDCGGSVWRRFHFAKPQVFRNSLSNLVGSKVMCPLSLYADLWYCLLWRSSSHVTSGTFSSWLHKCILWPGVMHGWVVRALWIGSPLWFKIVLGFMSVLAVSPLATTAPFLDVDILRQSPCHHVIVSIRCWHVLPWIECTKCEWIAVKR